MVLASIAVEGFLPRTAFGHHPMLLNSTIQRMTMQQ
jgi:hypothetical protein